MNSTTLIYILLGLAILALISYRQMQFSAVNLGKAIRLPIVLLAVAVLIGVQSATPEQWDVSGTDIALLCGEVLVAIAAGWIMGRLTQVQVVDTVLCSRVRGAGVAVWCAYLVLRITGSVIAHLDHLTLSASLPAIFVMLAIVKGTQAIVVARRVHRHSDEAPAAHAAHA